MRGKDPYWEYATPLEKHLKCNFCGKELYGGISRFKNHLARLKNKDVAPCPNVPLSLSTQVRESVQSVERNKVSKKKRSSEVPISPSQNSINPITLDLASPTPTMPSPSLFSPQITTPTSVDGSWKKQVREEADRLISLFFYDNGLAFNAAKSRYYQPMIDAIASCGVGYKGPSSEAVRTALLERAKVEADEFVNDLRKEWKDSGCTIMCDAWNDNRSRTLLNFFVACPKGTVFLKSFDASGHLKDSHYLLGFFESVLKDVGVENVVQVVTDNTDEFLAVGELLKKNYKSIFCSPCSAHCIDSMLKDLGSLTLVSSVLNKARLITKFIYGHSWVLEMTRRFTNGKELLHPGIIWFASNFISLQCILCLKDNLRHMFSHPEWKESKFSKRADAQPVAVIIQTDEFWSAAQEVIGISEPLVKVLKIVDGSKPAMGYVLEAMNRAKESIEKHFNGVSQNYKTILDLIDKWEKQLHTPLHAAGAYLNPHIFYNKLLPFGEPLKNGLFDGPLKNGLFEVLHRMVPDQEDQQKMTVELPKYAFPTGIMGNNFAIMGRSTTLPSLWWLEYGVEAPRLQKVAIRVLSQVCSVSRFEKNWRFFEQVHSKRNRLDQEKLDDLVFVKYNMYLKEKCKRGLDFAPIIFDEIDITSEWVTNNEAPLLPLSDESWLNNDDMEAPSGF